MVSPEREHLKANLLEVEDEVQHACVVFAPVHVVSEQEELVLGRQLYLFE